jgi:hypothetical protein
MDDDLDGMSREQLILEVRKLRAGIRQHRDSIPGGPDPGQTRDRSGSGRGQARDRSGSGPGQVGVRPPLVGALQDGRAECSIPHDSCV